MACRLFPNRNACFSNVVMNDGSWILLNSHYGDCTPEKAIDLDQVDHVLMADGTKLMMPES